MNKVIIGIASILAGFTFLTSHAMSPLDKLENNLMSIHGRLFKQKVVTEYMRSDELQSWYKVISQFYNFVTERTNKFDKELETLIKASSAIILATTTNYRLNIGPALSAEQLTSGTKNLADIDWQTFELSKVIYQFTEVLKLRHDLAAIRNKLETSKHFWDSKSTRDTRSAILFLNEILDAVLVRIFNELLSMIQYAKKQAPQQ